MISYISILTCLLLTVCAGKSEAFSSHETINSAKKYFDEFNDLSGPIFDAEGSFAYAKIQYLKKPLAIQVTLEIFHKNSSEFRTSTKKFVTDAGNTNITAALLNLNPTILAVSEILETGEKKTQLVEWDPLSYIDPKLNLPMDYIFMKNRGSGYQVLLNDKLTCGTSNGKCRLEFDDSHKPQKSEFYHGDLIWPGLQVDYIVGHSVVYLIRGYDAAGNFKFLKCETTSWSRGCTEFLSLPVAGTIVESHPTHRGICLIENPGKNRSVNCLEFYMHPRKGNNVAVNKTMTFEEPITLLDVSIINDSEMLLIARKANCLAEDCLNIIVDKTSEDEANTLTTRYNVKLECSEDDTLLKVSAKKNNLEHTLVIDYVCETFNGFTFKSATIKDA